MGKWLLSAVAALALAWPFSAHADPLTLDTLLGVESFGRIAIDPTGRTAVFEERRSRDDLPRYDLQPEGMLRYARLYRFDVDRPTEVRPLLAMEPDAGYTLGPFSPDGDRLVVFRLQGLTFRLGIVDLVQDHVLWTDLSPETGAWGRAVEWISDDAFVVLAMPEGTLPPRLSDLRRTQATLPDLWAQAARGAAAWVSVGLDLPRAPPPVRQLHRIDARTGGSMLLSEGPFLDLEASPDGRHLALILDGPLQSLPDPDQTAEIRRRRSLRLIDIGTGAAVDPREAGDISTSLLSWSPRSRALLVAALHGPIPRLLSVSPEGRTQDVTPAGVTPSADSDGQLLPTAKAAWLDGRPIVRGFRDGQAGWYLQAGVHAPSRVDLGADARLIAQGENALLFHDQGRVIRLNADGQAEVLGEAADIVRPEGPFGQRALTQPMKATSAAIRSGEGVLCRVAADPEPRRCLTGATGSAVSWALAISLGTGLEGRSVNRLLWHGPTGTRTIWRLNPELDRVDVPRPRRIAGENGAWGWLYLPDRSGDRPPAVIVIPYPGRTYPDPPRAMRPEAGQITQSGALLVAAGYAVLYPDLPSGPEPSDRLAERILAPVDAAGREGLVDADRIGLWGHSFGAWASVLSAAQSDRFRAVVALNGSYNLPSALAGLSAHDRIVGANDDSITSAARWLEAGQVGMGRAYWSDPERYHRASPFHRADAVAAPVLLIHGELDFSTGQAEQMYAALHRLNRPAALTYLFGEDHSIHNPGNARIYYEQVFAWFDRHLRPDDAPASPTNAGPMPR